MSVREATSPAEAINLTIESKSLPVEVNRKEKFATILIQNVEANHSTVNNNYSNGCLHFGMKSESFSPIEIIHSMVKSNCFSTVETKENFSSTVKLSFAHLH